LNLVVLATVSKIQPEPKAVRMPFPIFVRAINQEPTFVSGIQQRILAPATPWSLSAHSPPIVFWIVYISTNSTTLHPVELAAQDPETFASKAQYG
jgi:hypothetical protein